MTHPPLPTIQASLPAVRHVIYLHGFASSPESSKARRFALELARRGVGFSCPDLNLPEFETLTIARMLDQVAHTLAQVDDGPVALIGSSLGAFVALHAAAPETAALGGPEGSPTGERARAEGGEGARAALGAGHAAPLAKIDRLVLLAPALDFGGNRLRQLGEHGIDEWRRRTRLRVFHYAWNEEREIGFALYEDAARFDAFTVTTTLPILVFQGTRDESVDPEMVARWAGERPSVDLRLVDDGHQLAASIDLVWRASARFLGLA